MPKRIVKTPVFVFRDGKQVPVPVGETFDFTDSELKEINSLQPKALGHIITPEPQPVKVSSVAVTASKD